MFSVQPTSICHIGRQGFESPRSTYLLPFQRSNKNPRFMPTASQLLEYGLECGDRARARDTDCSICQERVTDPVITPCQHIYCFECIYEWLRRNTKCPECRRALQRTRSSSPSAFAAIVASTPTLVGRFSSSQRVTRTASLRKTSVCRCKDPFTPDPYELAERLAALESTVLKECSCRVPNESGNTATRLARTWCLQRHMPLRNRAADPVICYGLSDEAPSFCGQSIDQTPTQTRGISVIAPRSSTKRLPHRAATMPLPALDDDIHMPTLLRGRSRDDQMITIDAEEMLSRMWQTSNALAGKTDMPIRCKAISKCVWREWREFLQNSDGRCSSVQTLLNALNSKFEQAVVDYGWGSDWRNLPEAFLEAIKKTARAAVESESTGNFHTHGRKDPWKDSVII